MTFLLFASPLVLCVFGAITCLNGQSFDLEEKTLNICEESEKVTEPKKEKEKKTDNAKEEEEPPKIGNFALPTSQQPAGLFAFGGNIIDKNEVQLYLFADYFRGKKRIVSDVIPSILFGVTDDLSLFFNFPVTPILKDGRDQSRGAEDFFIQLEYAFYNKKTAMYADVATIVGNITFPTGSDNKRPPTGYGSPSLFLGGTYYHTMIDWFVFTSHGGILTTRNFDEKVGDQFLYQFGFGKNIPSPEGWIYAWMLEVDGQYSKKNRINNVLDPNSGGNLIFVTPSIWVSSKYTLFQFGISIPVNQNLFGNQKKISYGFNLNMAYTFY